MGALLDLKPTPKFHSYIAGKGRSKFFRFFVSFFSSARAPESHHCIAGMAKGLKIGGRGLVVICWAESVPPGWNRENWSDEIWGVGQGVRPHSPLSHPDSAVPALDTRNVHVGKKFKAVSKAARKLKHCTVKWRLSRPSSFYSVWVFLQIVTSY